MEQVDPSAQKNKNIGLKTKNAGGKFTFNFFFTKTIMFIMGVARILVYKRQVLNVLVLFDFHMFFLSALANKALTQSLFALFNLSL